MDNEIVKTNIHNTKIQYIEDKTPGITALNAKINKVKYKRSSIANLATNNSLNDRIHEIKQCMPSMASIATIIDFTAVDLKYLMLVI